MKPFFQTIRCSYLISSAFINFQTVLKYNSEICKNYILFSYELWRMVTVGVKYRYMERYDITVEDLKHIYYLSLYPWARLTKTLFSSSRVVLHIASAFELRLMLFYIAFYASEQIISFGRCVKKSRLPYFGRMFPWLLILVYILCKTSKLWFHTM